MMKIASLRFLFLASLISLCAGCATPSKEELSTASVPALPKDYKEQATKYLKKSLKDPWSAVFEFRDQPRKGWTRDGWAHGSKLHVGWYVPVYVNAKNSYGGYTGFELYLLFYDQAGWYGGTTFGAFDPDNTRLDPLPRQGYLKE